MPIAAQPARRQGQGGFLLVTDGEKGSVSSLSQIAEASVSEEPVR
jgi:hypothetical protein